VLQSQTLKRHAGLGHWLPGVQFHTRNVSELAAAKRSIIQIPKNVLMVYVRGYAPFLAPALRLQLCRPDARQLQQV